MSLTRQQLFTEALALDPPDREALAEDILRTLGETERSEIDEAWLLETRKRDAAYRRGESTTSTVEEVISRILSRKRP